MSTTGNGEMNKLEIPSSADLGLPPEVAQTVVQATISRLKDWKLPEFCQRAAQWTILGRELSSEMTDEAETAIILAGRVRKWYGSILALTESSQPEGPPPGAYSYLVRGLLREIYCDYPDFSFILLLFAYQDARLREIPDEKLAEVTLGIFAPLAEILGLWRLRREWLEQSTRILATSQGPWKRQLTETQRLVKRLHWHSLEELERLPAEWRKRRANHTLDVKNWEVHNRRRTERAEFFLKLREILQDKANQAGFKAMPRIELRLFSPERLAGRAILEKAEPGEHLNRLWVRVFCATEAECYQMLGLAHSLGKPLGSGYSDHFEDYLVAAQPNGNRVLRTAFIFRPADYYTGFEYGGNVIVELRLLTENAHKVNENGVVEVFYRQPDLCNDINYRDAWWSPVQNKILLANINSCINSSSKDQSYQSVEEFLRQHELGTRSPNQYVFTPKGQIRIMSDSSTALDFAYEIHSELGEHASQIKINQQPVSYDERLKNGDMVEVELDERFHGPDPSWLNFVSTALARKRIRRQLTRASKAVHSGRALFNRQLIQTLTFYQEKRGFNLRFTGRQIDDFLLNYARARGKPDLKALFDSISVRRSARNQITPQQIVHRLVSEVLANYLVDWFGEALPYPPYRINVCDNCRPVPGMPIVAFESGSPGYERLSVHARECEPLLRDGNSHKRVTVKWASQRGKLSGGELLVHAGVPIDLEALLSPVAIAVMVGLVVGKPVGVLLASWLAVAAGVAQLPSGVSWKAIAGGGMLAGIGFTMALFIASLAFADESAGYAELLQEAKIGILAGSTVAAVLGMTLLIMALSIFPLFHGHRPDGVHPAGVAGDVIVLGHVSRRVDAGSRCFEVIVHLNPQVHLDPVSVHKGHSGIDSLADHHDVAGNLVSVGKQRLFDLTVAVKSLGFTVHTHFQPPGRQFIQDHFPGLLIHLHGERVTGAYEHGDRQAPPQEAVSRLEPHQSAAQNQDPPRLGKGFDHSLHVRFGAHEKDVFQIGVFRCDVARVRSAGDEQPVKRNNRSFAGGHFPRFRVDFLHPFANDRFDIHVLVKIRRADGKGRRRDGSLQDQADHGAAVWRMDFSGDDGYGSCGSSRRMDSAPWIPAIPLPMMTCRIVRPLYEDGE